jgi:hypothetical protein
VNNAAKPADNGPGGIVYTRNPIEDLVWLDGNDFSKSARACSICCGCGLVSSMASAAV